MRPEVLSVFAQLFGSIMDSLRAGKQAAHINAEEVPLASDGACFGVLDSAIKVRGICTGLYCELVFVYAE